MVKPISNEECRLRLTELAEEVRRTGIPIGVHSVAGKPRYQLISEAKLDSDRVRNCVRLGPDKFRKYFSEVRALALHEDIPFGLMVHGNLIAIFQRDPDYRFAKADEFRAEFKRRGGKRPSDLSRRILALETEVAALSVKMDDISDTLLKINDHFNRMPKATKTTSRSGKWTRVA
jgi:hypothetical protein